MEDEVGVAYGKDEKYKVLVGKPKGKISCGRPRHRQEDSTEINLKYVVAI
jgi:hypothetical protein